MSPTAPATPTVPALTPSLEDYLETIYEVSRTRRVARVRDIATARDVKASSVTPAMKRLQELGLIRYEQREYIVLTPEGETAARRVLARHHVLSSFFADVLQLGPEAAAANACAIEHHLSDEAMDRLVRFFEYMRACPHASTTFLERFHGCARVHSELSACPAHCPFDGHDARDHQEHTMSLADLTPGQDGKVVQVTAAGAIRQRLLDMGLLPDEVVHVERVAPAGDPIWIRLGGFQLSLRRAEARGVQIAAVKHPG